MQAFHLSLAIFIIKDLEANASKMLVLCKSNQSCFPHFPWFKNKNKLQRSAHIAWSDFAVRRSTCWGPLKAVVGKHWPMDEIIPSPISHSVTCIPLRNMTSDDTNSYPHSLSSSGAVPAWMNPVGYTDIGWQITTVSEYCNQNESQRLI